MKRTSWRLILLLVSLLILMVISTFAVGPKWIPFNRWLPLLFAGPGGGEAAVLWHLRMPRVLLAALLGAALGGAGTGYQGLFRNALADPFVIGASSGAALGATLAIATGWHGALWWGPDIRYLSALLGAIGVVALVYAIASIERDIPTMALLLAGVAVSSFVGAVVSLIMFMQNQQLTAIFTWLMGSLSRSDWSAVGAAAPLIALGCTGMWLLSRPLDCFSFGDETTASLGFNLPRVRALIVLAASLTTAAAVAGAGIIGFVGLIAPHMARLIMGTSRHSIVFPASCLVGALLLLAADDAARALLEWIAVIQTAMTGEKHFGSGELPVGVITALLGGPFFLYLLCTRRYHLERR